MKVHLSIRRPGVFGGETVTSLCGRLNRASQDGMNLTGQRAEVTCAFCRKHPAFDKPTGWEGA